MSTFIEAGCREKAQTRIRRIEKRLQKKLQIENGYSRQDEVGKSHR